LVCFELKACFDFLKRDGLGGIDGIAGPPGNILIIPTTTGSKGPDNQLQV